MIGKKWIYLKKKKKKWIYLREKQTPQISEGGVALEETYSTGVGMTERQGWPQILKVWLALWDR